MAILSICIPTYNRSNYLEETIISIVQQKRFAETNDVEIIVSDNCSSDNTQEICEKYAEVYKEKFRYYRNIENIKDANFEKVLSYGKGLYLKLNNDTLKLIDGALDELISNIEVNLSAKPVIFFTNGMLNGFKTHLCNDLNSFVDKVSYWTTWIGCFGIWKHDFDSFEDFSKNAHLQLTQTEVILKIVSNNRKVFVNNLILFESIATSSKGGYNIYKVFACNYFQILKNYLAKERLSYWTYKKEEIKMINSFLIPWTVRIILEPKKYTFSTDDALRIVLKSFWKQPYLYVAIIPFAALISLNYLKLKFRF